MLAFASASLGNCVVFCGFVLRGTRHPKLHSGATEVPPKFHEWQYSTTPTPHRILTFTVEYDMQVDQFVVVMGYVINIICFQRCGN